MLLLLAGYAQSTLGSGIVLPFTVLYLRQALGLSAEMVAAFFALGAIAGLGGNLGAGIVTDRWGPRWCTIAGALFQAMGFSVLAVAGSPLAALAAAPAIGAGNGFFYPSWTSLLGLTVSEQQRPDAFSLRFLLTNAGVGLGALLGGWFLSTAAPWTFKVAYAVDAVTFLVLILTVLAARSPAPRGTPGPQAGRAAGGPADLFADPMLLVVVALNLGLVTFGYAQLESGVPLLAASDFRLPAWAIGLAFAANTGTVVALQWPLTRLLRSRPRTFALAPVGVVWAVAWTVLAPDMGSLGLRTGQLVLFAVAFAVGECLLAPSLGPLVVEIAPQARLGRYNAAVSFTWSLGRMAGPALGVTLVEHAPSSAYVAICGAACLVLAGGGRLAARLHRHRSWAVRRPAGPPAARPR